MRLNNNSVQSWENKATIYQTHESGPCHIGGQDQRTGATNASTGHHLPLPGYYLISSSVSCTREEQTHRPALKILHSVERQARDAMPYHTQVMAGYAGVSRVVALRFIHVGSCYLIDVHSSWPCMSHSSANVSCRMLNHGSVSSCSIACFSFSGPHVRQSQRVCGECVGTVPRGS